MENIKIGDTRTFERFPGIWTIIDIIKDKKIVFTLRLSSLKCRKCGELIYEPKGYLFNHIEKLENNNEIKYLGISYKDERYILLNDYLTTEEIKNKIAGVL